jgi:mannose-6-phosphate isomerase-like protein (cupin superfamily)
MNKKTLALTGIILGLSSASFVAGLAVAKGEAKVPVLSSLSAATWTPLMKEGPLPAMAPIQGDAMKGAHFAYLKLPAGFVSPAHSHSSDYWAVLVQGRMTHWASNGGSEADAKPLSVGDLTFMPAKVDHVSKCFPGVECIMAVFQKGKFDFIPAKELKTAKDSAKDAAKEPAKEPKAAAAK